MKKEHYKHNFSNLFLDECAYDSRSMKPIDKASIDLLLDSN